MSALGDNFSDFLGKMQQHYIVHTTFSNMIHLTIDIFTFAEAKETPNDLHHIPGSRTGGI